MSTSNSVANGARLDDCHSSVFSLADLSGIKWHKFSCDGTSLSNDPVLSAFTKCLALDILAVWRRSPKKSTQINPHLQDVFDKELWIFWWGEEPHVDEIAQLDGLRDEEKGAWEEGLSYECRTLLFKAIHNLVERCLLHENFVRIGQWFVRPMCKDTDEDISDRFSFSFSFFLHGESTVCTTIEVAKHKNLERLTCQHIQQVNGSNSQSTVILAPYGLRAKLTGVVYRVQDHTVRRLLEEWKPFYPLPGVDELFPQEDGCSDEEGEDRPVPPVVEVVLGGIHMNYPSHFVVVPVTELSSDTTTDNKTVPDSPQAGHVDNNTSTPRNCLGGPLSVQSVSELTPGPTSLDASYSSVQPSPRCPTNEESEKEPLQQQLGEPPHLQSSYLVNRVRLKSKWAPKSPLPPSPPPTTLRSLLDAPAQSSNSTLVSVKKEFPDNKPRIGWGFCDAFKDIRSAQTSADGELVQDGGRSLKLERQHRSQTCSPFHHRSDDNGRSQVKTSNYSFAISTSTSVISNLQEEGDNCISAHNFLQLPATSSPLYTHTMQDKMFTGPTMVSQDHPEKLLSRPFVTLGNSGENWVPADPVKTNISDVASNLPEENVIEIQRTVEDWKSYSLPLHTSASKPALKRPSLLRDGLANTFIHFSTRRKAGMDANSLYAFPISKKPKIENELFTERGALSNFHTEEDKDHRIGQELDNQHVTVVQVKGELAGMAVQDDPYAFDDPDDTVTQPKEYSNINLKNVPQSSWPSTQSPWPTIQTSDSMDSKNIKQELMSDVSGKSQLEALLRQTTSPLSHTTGQITQSIAFPGSKTVTSLNARSLKNKSDLEFSNEDLDSIFEEEENGAPTPPDEPYYNHDHSLQSIAPPVTTYAVQDLQRMFPTPPSLEPFQAVSPEGRAVIPVTSALLNSVNDSVPMNGADGVVSCYKRSIDNDKTDHTMVANRSDSNSIHDSPSVLMSLKMISHPSSSLYQPLHLSQLPLHNFYTPSWQVRPAMPQTPCIFPPSEVPSFPPSASPAHSLTSGVTPGTPGRSSVRTPASIQPYSVPTPGRSHGGVRSVESPRSFTPGSNLPTKRLFVDQHGSAALFINLLLSDSILNLFWDKSFDQCALCVCNTSINGADVALGYLPALSGQEAEYRCSCGFSAVRNRMTSVGSGLFLEDELEIVGARHEKEIFSARNLEKAATSFEDDVIHLAMEQCCSPFCISHLVKSKESELKTVREFGNIVVKRDALEAFAHAVNGGMSVVEPSMKVDADRLVGSFHPWNETERDALTCASTFDIYRLLVSLKPVLQDAIQKKRTSRSFGTTQHVKGPLTWREFCKEAGKMPDAEPQPIPSFVVGYDQNWLSISPNALKYWEKLFLEPYSTARDLVYVVVCPDEDSALSSSKLFFRELSSLFESYHLGRLKPYNKAFKESGILRVGRDTVSNDDTTLNQFPYFNQFYERTELLNKGYSTDDADKLLLYARACVENLAHVLKEEQNLDLSTLYIRESRSRPQPAQPPVNPVQSQSNDRNGGQLNHLPNSMNRPPPMGMQPSPTNKVKDVKDIRTIYPVPYNPFTASNIVIYILDPFQGALSRGLWHCFLSLQKSLPSPVKDHLILQIVPVEHVLQTTSSCGTDSFIHTLRSLCFSTFAQCRKNIPRQTTVRSMTKFGPKVNEDTSKTTANNAGLYTPPYILSHPQEKHFDLTNHNPHSETNVLFISYCLSHNQKWLLASATDQRGELLESCCINIDVPPRRLSMARKQRVSVRGEAIEKLWKFCISTSTRFSTKPWRIVIGKLGRLSHGEIKDWAKYLNRKVLLSSGKKPNCFQCKLQQHNDLSTFVSACLTSLEADGSLRIMPDVVQSNNFGRSSTNVSQTTQLRTPEDVSCTHIYVFPTSAVTQLPASNQSNTDEDLVQTDADILPDDVLTGMGDDILLELNGLLNATSPASNQPTFSISEDDIVNKNQATERLLSTEGGASEDASLLQQPLALGYLVSTAPPGPLPSWFWTNSHARDRCPVFLRSALHIQTSVNDATGSQNRKPHPLDSTKTAVVLRFVLENYNALSWLTRDPTSRDRRSCLPVHCLSLMQLYHTIENLT